MSNQNDELANMRPGEYRRISYVPDARDLLFDDLSNGRITPAEAEAKAHELGMEPLTPTLDPARFDPMRETHWTPAMAVSWIAWANLERVRDCLPRWRKQHQSWRWHEYTFSDGADGVRLQAGWVLEQTHKGEAPLMSLSLSEAFAASEDAASDTTQRHTIHDARLLLWEKLGAGELTAITMLNGRPVQISSHEWPFLEHIEQSNADVLRAGRDMFAPATTYNADEVLVRRDDVLRLWPARSPTMADEAKAEKALRELCQSCTQSHVPWPKSAEWRQTAVSDFGVSARGAQRVWAKVAQDFPALSTPAGKPKSRRAPPAKKPKRSAT